MSREIEHSSIRYGFAGRLMLWLLQLPGWACAALGLCGLVSALAFSLR